MTSSALIPGTAERALNWGAHKRASEARTFWGVLEESSPRKFWNLEARKYYFHYLIIYSLLETGGSPSPPAPPPPRLRRPCILLWDLTVSCKRTLSDNTGPDWKTHWCHVNTPWRLKTTLAYHVKIVFYFEKGALAKTLHHEKLKYTMGL